MILRSNRSRLTLRWVLNFILILGMVLASLPFGANQAHARPRADGGRQQQGPRYPTSLAIADDPDDPTIGSMLGQVEDATTGEQLPGVQVVAEGVLDAFPLPVYLPFMLVQAGKSAAPALRFTPEQLAETAIFTLTTGIQGDYQFAVPAGDYTLTYSLDGYTPDKRERKVRANEVLKLDAIRLHVQDPVVTDLGVSGGTAVNSLGNSNVEFPPGALDDDAEVRVTYVDNADLPGFFPDGSAPMGFSSFEPEGTVFPAGKEVVWTVEYTGTLPIGSDTLCYWWDGETQNWKDPVPGKVVDLGEGKKGLRAEVPHFSFYGHAIPAVAGQQPGQNGDASTTQANAGEGNDQFR